MRYLENIKADKWYPPSSLQWCDLTGSPLDEFYTKENTKHKQVFDFAPKYIKKFADSKFSFYTSSIIKQNPGNFIPLHLDTYEYFSDKFNVTDISKIKRYNFFLEDWKPGHFMDVEGVPIISWKAGDYLIFDSTIYHCSVNAGQEPKYTCQITGIENK